MEVGSAFVTAASISNSAKMSCGTREAREGEVREGTAREGEVREGTAREIRGERGNGERDQRRERSEAREERGAYLSHAW